MGVTAPVFPVLVTTASLCMLLLGEEKHIINGESQQSENTEI